MEKEMKLLFWFHNFGVPFAYLWLTRNEGVEQNMGTTIMGLGFRRNGKENGNYYNGCYRDYYRGDPFLHS